MTGSRGGGGGGGGNSRVILARVCKAVFWIQPQSYNWPLKKTCTRFHRKLTNSYTILEINIPFYTKNNCINMCVRKFGPFIYQHQKIGPYIYFLLEKGGFHKPGGAENGGYSARTSVLYR